MATFTDVVWAPEAFSSWAMPEEEPMAGSSTATSAHGFSGVVVGEALRANGSPPPPAMQPKSSGAAVTAELAVVIGQDCALLNSRSICCIML